LECSRSSSIGTFVPGRGPKVRTDDINTEERKTAQTHENH